MELGNGQRWHLRKGMTPDDIPTADPVGDALQAAAKEIAPKWGPHKLTFSEREAVENFLRAGQVDRASLLERRARGKWVEAQLREQFKHLRWSSRGVDAVDPATGRARIVRFQSHFHGWHDAVSVGSDPPYDTLAVPGVPDAVTANTVVIPPNDVEVLERTLREVRDDAPGPWI